MIEKNEKKEVKLELTDEQLEAVNGGFTLYIYCPFCVEPVSVDIEDLRRVQSSVITAAFAYGFKRI